MIDLFYFFGPSIVMAFILVGIHCYLGLHVLKRQVIFIDLSLAQVAALGYAVGSVLGLEIHSFSNYCLALGHTFLAALLFSLARRTPFLTQETLIGVTYAFASSMVIIVMSHSPHGMEYIKEMLVGRMLWIQWPEVTKVLMIYTPVLILHYIFRRQFFALSEGKKISHGTFWNFIFYALFGIVITSSVGSAGLLLVFSLLIVPPLLASRYYSTTKGILCLGWFIGALLCVLGLFMSYSFDLPMGAVTVALSTGLAILSALFAVKNSDRT